MAGAGMYEKVKCKQVKKAMYWKLISVIQLLRRLRLEDCYRFEASLGLVSLSYLPKQNQQQQLNKPPSMLPASASCDAAIVTTALRK